MGVLSLVWLEVSWLGESGSSSSPSSSHSACYDEYRLFDQNLFFVPNRESHPIDLPQRNRFYHVVIRNVWGWGRFNDLAKKTHLMQRPSHMVARNLLLLRQNKHTHLDGCTPMCFLYKKTKCLGYCLSWLLWNSFRTSIRIAIAYQDSKLLGNGRRNRWWRVEACHETYHSDSLISANQVLLYCESIVSFDTRWNKQRPSIDPLEAIEIPKW